jgi:thioredoxin-like negative regulator of GroEL
VYRELTKLAALRKPGTFCVYAVDVDDDGNKELASRCRIQSLPTLVFVGACACVGMWQYHSLSRCASD